MPQSTRPAKLRQAQPVLKRYQDGNYFLQHGNSGRRPRRFADRARNGAPPAGPARTVDRARRKPGGEHVWSFFESDVAPAHRDLVEPLIARRWSGYDVHFPGYSRRLGTAYASVTSRRLDEVVRAALPADALLTGAEVRQAAPTGVILADGREIRADAVIDARGAHGLPYMSGGWQSSLAGCCASPRPTGLTGRS